MTGMMGEIFWLVLVVGLVVGFGRWVPLSTVRKIGVIGLRGAAVLGVLMSLRGCSVLRLEERPQHVVYLVDQSASIDEAQTWWIARRLASLEAIRPAPVSRTILAFGGGAQVVMSSSQSALAEPQELERLLAAAATERDATDLEQALLSSLSTTPPQEHRRVILLSDGRQTRGNVERILPFLRRFHVEVYPVAIPADAPSGLIWERLTVPPVVHQGASVPLSLVFTNGTDQVKSVDVTASLGGLELAHQRARLTAGWRILSLSVPALHTGTMALEVTVAVSGETQPQQRLAYVEVEGPPKLLFVVDRPTQLPPLATALKRRDMELSVLTPAEVPVDVGKWLEYDSVVLFQIPKSSLTHAQVEALTQYVQRFGGGMVMVGLGGNLKDELTHDAPLDQLLPARFEPKGVQEAKRRICIVMLIDRSASMMGPRIAATKRAAVELVRQLAPEDLVGVLAFDTVAYVVVEVQPARQVSATLIEKLVHLKSTGGTDLLPALRAAQTRLAASGATVKHVMLLSDGNTPFPAKLYQELLARLNQEHVTISTIGIGSAFVNTEFLAWLATKTGGEFYQMRNLDELPQLIARDTQKTLGQLPFSEGYFHPTRGPSATWFEEVTDWPALKGYLTTTAKPQATVELELHHADDVEPLLAQWTVGRGRVALFASDADRRWSSEWVRWPQFDSVWAHLVRQTMRPRPTQDAFVWVEDQAGSPHLVVEADVSNPAAQLVSSDGRTITPLSLVQSGRFRWHAPVGHLDSGWYRLLLSSDDGASDVLMKRWVQIGRVESLREQLHLPPDEALLGRIAQETGGTLNVPDRAFVPPTQPVEHRVPLRGWLLPLALVLFLVDVALRGRTML